MSRFRTLFISLPVSRKIIVVLWLFVAIVIALLILSYQIIGSLSALRAYVEGEGLWSKAQKQAVHNLTRYASSRSEQDFRAYEKALQAPLGDKKARLELERPSPDLRVVYEGFIQGRNSPDARRNAGEGARIERQRRDRKGEDHVGRGRSPGRQSRSGKAPSVATV